MRKVPGLRAQGLLDHVDLFAANVYHLVSQGDTVDRLAVYNHLEVDGIWGIYLYI